MLCHMQKSTQKPQFLCDTFASNRISSIKKHSIHLSELNNQVSCRRTYDVSYQLLHKLITATLDWIFM